MIIFTLDFSAKIWIESNEAVKKGHYNFQVPKKHIQIDSFDQHLTQSFSV